MFKNLFKSSNPSIQTSEVEVAQQKQIIDSAYIKKDMHLSFEEVLKEYGLTVQKQSKVEELQEQLKEFRQENIGIYDKIKKLQDLGFVNTPSVRIQLDKLHEHESKINEKINKVQNGIDSAKRIESLNREYMLKYPGYKFIDDNTMISIMRKYNLICGESFMYNREIPEEALNIISNFSKEIEESKTRVVLESTTWITGLLFRPMSVRYSIKEVSFDYQKPKQSFDTLYRIENNFYPSKLKMIAPESHFTVPTKKEENSLGKEINVPIMEIDEQTLSYRFTTQKLNEVVRERQEVLDPIASLKVEGGYIVLHAWDKEAEIPEIKNPLMN